jgi:hypothetical protein
VCIGIVGGVLNVLVLMSLFGGLHLPRLMAIGQSY